MFCQTIVLVFLAIPILSAIFEGSSVISTISAASTAASEPRAPIANPISDPARRGASFIPSPTAIVVVFLLRYFLRILSLSPGRSPA